MTQQTITETKTNPKHLMGRERICKIIWGTWWKCFWIRWFKRRQTNCPDC